MSIGSAIAGCTGSEIPNRLIYDFVHRTAPHRTVPGGRGDMIRHPWSFQKSVIRRLTSEARSICTM